MARVGGFKPEGVCCKPIEAVVVGYHGVAYLAPAIKPLTLGQTQPKCFDSYLGLQLGCHFDCTPRRISLPMSS